MLLCTNSKKNEKKSEIYIICSDGVGCKQTNECERVWNIIIMFWLQL